MRLPLVAGPPAPVRAGQWRAYGPAGLAVTEHQYERLWPRLHRMAPPPTVILRYNPAPYEGYRGTRLAPHARAEQRSAVQRAALRAFAHTHGWRFLELTEPLREVVQAGAVWLYGGSDQSHWSPQGIPMVAAVLAAKLVDIIAPAGRSGSRLGGDEQ
jgi:hypothetical protein